MKKNKTGQSAERVIFTKEMKRDYTIIFPTMLPRHFKLINKLFHYYGYNTVLLENGTHGDSKSVIDAGLRSVHNDACYPALLVTGQLIDALESGKYDPHKTAVLMFQTGGGCRASNYVSLIRKALKKANFEYVPVISMSFTGIEKNPGFKLTFPMLHRALYAILYGDLLMTLINQTRPRETVKGSAEALADKWVDILAKEITEGRISYGKVKKNYRNLLLTLHLQGLLRPKFCG